MTSIGYVGNVFFICVAAVWCRCDACIWLLSARLRKSGVLQAREATSTLAAASTQRVDAAAAAQRAANAVQDAENALADARRAADAVQVMLQAKQAQGLQSQAEELAAMAQMHANEVHR